MTGHNALLDNTRQMLDLLGENQLEAVNSIVKAFIVDSPYKPENERELYARIDRSIAQADAGELEDADKAINEIMTELNL